MKKNATVEEEKTSCGYAFPIIQTKENKLL